MDDQAWSRPGRPESSLARLRAPSELTYRLGLQRGMFIAYSSGKLPFDRSAEKIYEIGFSFKLD